MAAHLWCETRATLCPGCTQRCRWALPGTSREGPQPPARHRRAAPGNRGQWQASCSRGCSLPTCIGLAYTVAVGNVEWSLQAEIGNCHPAQSHLVAHAQKQEMA